jgi:hypothetical protein
VDANLCGDGLADRYDLGSPHLGFAETGFDALVNNDTETGPLGIPNCTDYRFSHSYGLDSFDDAVQNLNSFKQIAGAFGLCTISSTGEPCGVGLTVELRRGVTGTGVLVKTGVVDEDGAYAVVHKHKGKPANYTVSLIIDGPCGPRIKQIVELQGNGWSNVNFDVSDCSSTAEYGKGRNAR